MSEETTAAPDSRAVLQRLLKDRPVLFDEINEERELIHKTSRFLIVTVALGAAYGASMGFHHSIAMALLAAAKVPLLLLGVLVFCLPALYVFNVLLGSRMSFLQVTTLLSMSTSVMAIVLGALAPITLFCVLTGATYEFMVIINVLCFAIAGFFNIDYLWHATKRIATARGGERDMTILAGWIVIYALLGTQLAWSMRPFIGSPDEAFVILRGGGGNFFDAVWGVVDAMLS